MSKKFSKIENLPKGRKIYKNGQKIPENRQNNQKIENLSKSRKIHKNGQKNAQKLRTCQKVEKTSRKFTKKKIPKN